MAGYSGMNAQECTSQLVLKVQGEVYKEAQRRSNLTFFAWIGCIGGAVLARKLGMDLPDLTVLGGILALYLPHYYYSHLARDIKSKPGMFYEMLKPRVQEALLSHFSPQGKANQ